MSNSTLLNDYLGEGTHANRPAAPPVAKIAIYYETDTANTFLYDVNGAAWVQIAGQGAAGSAMSLISTLTASNSATLAWTGLASQTSWKLVGRLLVPATNSTSLSLQVGTGAGPTYVTTGYTFARKVEYSSSSGADDGSNSYTEVVLDDGAVKNASPGTSFEAEIITDNANFVQVVGKSYSTNQTADQLTIFGSKVAITGAITALKLFMHSGNITSGTASLYSLAH